MYCICLFYDNLIIIIINYYVEKIKKSMQFFLHQKNLRNIIKNIWYKNLIQENHI
jgi:hypothetical protein